MTWEEGLTSFWVTLPCIIVGVVLLILPTTFILQWIFRILVWTFLGPWYRIFCDLFRKNISTFSLQSDSEDDRKQHKLSVMDNVEKDFEQKGRIARIKGEEAAKLKAMRVIRNGKYIARIPSRNLTRHYDYPEASESFASMTAFKKEHELPPVNYAARKVVSSQRLEGLMIPLTIEQSECLLQQKNTELASDLIQTEDQCTRIGNEGGSSLTSLVTEDANMESLGKDIEPKIEALDSNDTRGSGQDYEGSDFESDNADSMAPGSSTDGIRTENRNALVLQKSNDEEGLEVIDFVTAATDTYEDADIVDTDNDELPKHDDEKSLSTIYKSSDTVFVAFCRK